MSDTPSWYGYCRLFGRWIRVVGPCPDRSTASRALDAAIRERRIYVHQRWHRLTTGEPPRD